MDLDFNDELANLELLLRELVLVELGRPTDDACWRDGEWFTEADTYAPLSF